MKRLNCIVVSCKVNDTKELFRSFLLSFFNASQFSSANYVKYKWENYQ